MALNDVLKRHNFIAGLSDSHVALLSSLARQVAFEENELVLVSGKKSKYLYLLLSGSVCVEVRTRSYSVCIQALGPGEAFGWSSLLDHHDTLFQVRAREPSTALKLSGSRISAACRKHPELAAELLHRALRLAAGRVQACEMLLSKFCGAPANSKLATVPAGSSPSVSEFAPPSA